MVSIALCFGPHAIGNGGRVRMERPRPTRSRNRHHRKTSPLAITMGQCRGACARRVSSLDGIAGVAGVAGAEDGRSHAPTACVLKTPGERAGLWRRPTRRGARAHLFLFADDLLVNEHRGECAEMR